MEILPATPPVRNEALAVYRADRGSDQTGVMVPGEPCAPVPALTWLYHAQ
jgi:hypothetical protein